MTFWMIVTVYHDLTLWLYQVYDKKYGDVIYWYVFGKLFFDSPIVSRIILDLYVILFSLKY